MERSPCPTRTAFHTNHSGLYTRGQHRHKIMRETALAFFSALGFCFIAFLQPSFPLLLKSGSMFSFFFSFCNAIDADQARTLFLSHFFRHKRPHAIREDGTRHDPFLINIQGLPRAVHITFVCTAVFLGLFLFGLLFFSFLFIASLYRRPRWTTRAPVHTCCAANPPAHGRLRIGSFWL